MLAYELLAYLKYLVLTGQNEDGELEWIGKTSEWNKAVKDIAYYETFQD